MAGISYPGVSGAAALGAQHGLASGIKTGLEMRQADELSLVRGLQAQREALGLAQEQNAESAFVKGMNAPQETPMYEPATEGSIAANIPGVTPGVEPWAPPGQPQMEGGPSNYVAAPSASAATAPGISIAAGKPAVTGAPYTSMASLKSVMSPKEFAALAMSPRGQTLFKLKNVMTEAEVDKMQRNREGFKRLKKNMEDAQIAFDNGDVSAGLHAQAAGFLAKADLDDDPQKWFDKYEAKQGEIKAWAKDQDNPKIAQALQDWYADVSKHQEKYNNDPSSANLEAYRKAIWNYPKESHLAQQAAPIMMRQLAEHTSTQSHPTLEALRRDVDAMGSNGIPEGTDATMTQEKVAESILNQDPKRRAAVQSVLLNQIEQGKKPPEWQLRVTGLHKVTKDAADLAGQRLRDRGLDPNLDKNGEAFASEVIRIQTETAHNPDAILLEMADRQVSAENPGLDRNSAAYQEKQQAKFLDLQRARTAAKLKPAPGRGTQQGYVNDVASKEFGEGTKEALELIRLYNDERKKAGMGEESKSVEQLIAEVRAGTTGVKPAPTLVPAPGWKGYFGATVEAPAPGKQPAPAPAPGKEPAGTGGPMTSTGQPTPKWDTLSLADKMARRAQAVSTLFSGKTWEQLTPAQKLRVQDSLSEK